MQTRIDMSLLTDAELLRKARRDVDAFHEFYERYVDTIDAWLRRQTGDDDAAAELTAETFAQAWSSRKRFRDQGEASGIRWLFGIAKNLVRVYYRKRSVAETARRKLGMELGRTVPAASEHDDRFDSVELVLEQLPEHQRAALEMRVVEDLSYDQIAVRLDCTENAARVRVSRALATLRAGGAAKSGAELSG